MKEANEPRGKEQQGTAVGTSSSTPMERERAGQGQQRSEASSAAEKQQGSASAQKQHQTGQGSQTAAGSLHSQSGMKGEGSQQESQGRQMTAANGGTQRHMGMAPRGWFDTNPWMENPFGMMRRFSEEMDKLFEDFRMGQGMLSSPSAGRRAGLSQWSPQVEMYEKDSQLVICTDLPGMKQEDIQLEVQENMLIIQGERRNEFEDSREGYYRSERSYGSFSRAIPLPQDIDPEQAKASFENGVLKVMFALPQQHQQRRRRIEVQAGPGQQSSAGGQAGSSRSSSTEQGA